MQVAGAQRAKSVLWDVLGNQVPALGSITIGLLGRGIGASLSPAMHEQEGRRLGLDYHYHLIDFDRLGLADTDLPQIIAEAQALGFAGLNVTYPFKQAILPLLDELGFDTVAIGAANTVVFSKHRSIGHNTDCWGFAESFRRGLPDVRKHRVLQLGSGGAGAAVARALLQGGVGQLDIYDIVPARAAELAARLRTSFNARITVTEDLAYAADAADGIVNTTPVGMTKHPGLPLATDLLATRHWVADIVYFPLETELIARARAMGCRVLPGGGMAIYQAVRAFELFAGIKPDAEAMAKTFQAAMMG